MDTEAAATPIVRTGQYARAIEDYNQSIRLDKDNVLEFYDRGCAYFLEQNLTAAISDFEHVISAASVI